MTRMMNNKMIGDSEKDKFEGKPIGHIFDLYLCGEILPPENYIDQFEIIRNAGENDVIRLHINSAGGDLSTAIQFNRVIQETQAQICASAEGYCMSAATMIFLAANMFEISDHCFFMFHNYSQVDHLAREVRCTIISSVNASGPTS